MMLMMIILLLLLLLLTLRLTLIILNPLNFSFSIFNLLILFWGIINIIPFGGYTRGGAYIPPVGGNITPPP